MGMEFFGKYRGKVIDNNDPLKRGRLRTNVPAISDHDLTWAEPCTPYAGPKMGWYVIPPVGANVWIEFERGDVDYPIWTGCFWGLDEKDGIPPDAQDSDIKVFQTEKMTLILDDNVGRFTAEVKTDGGTVSLVLDANSIVMTSGTATISVTPAGIALKNESTTVELSTAAIDLKNGASSISMSPATVSINNGALEVM